MYYEEAKVKEYIRNKGTLSEKKFQQIYLGNSKFKKNDIVIIIKSEDFNEFSNNSTAEKVAELESIIDNLRKEKQKLKQELQELKTDHENYIKETESSIEEATNIVNDVKAKSEKLKKDYKKKLEDKDSIIETKDSTIEEKDLTIKEKDSAITKKDSIIENLTNELTNEKDYSKALLIVRNDLLKRNVVKRLFNVEPDSSKMVAELKPKEINLETNTEN